MGVTSAENGDTAMDMITAKPRERQFQVVPVPGKFTRGRWQCWDYRDEKPDVSDEILDFTDKAEKSAPPATLPVASEAQPLSNVNAAQQQSDVLLTHTVSEPMLITQCGGGGAAQVAPDMPLGTQPTSAHKESSTIVVTSIAPAAVTPVHGTPSSSVDMANGVDTNIANVQVPSAMTIVSSDVGSEDVISPPQTLSNAGITLSTSSASIPIGTASSQDGCGVPCSTSPSVPAVPANSFVNPSIMSAAPTPSPLPQQSSAQGTAPTTLSRQTSLASFHDGGAAPVISTLTPIDGAVEDPLLAILPLTAQAAGG